MLEACLISYVMELDIQLHQITGNFNRHRRLPEDGFIKKPKHVGVLNNFMFYLLIF